MKMSMTWKEKKAYQRGYNNGLSNKYPQTLPPLPPIEILNSFLVEAKKLRDFYDMLYATSSGDDELMIELDNLLIEFDKTFDAYESWLKQDVLLPTK